MKPYKKLCARFTVGRIFYKETRLTTVSDNKAFLFYSVFAPIFGRFVLFSTVYVTLTVS